MQPHCLLCTQSMSRDCSTTSLPMFRKLHSLPLHLSAVFHEPTTILVDDHHYPSYIVSLRKTKAGRRGRINLARPPRGPAPDARLTAPRRLEYVCLVCVCYLCWNAPHYRVCSSPVCCLLGVFEFQLGIVTSPTYTGGHFFLSHVNGICCLIPVTSINMWARSSIHSSPFPAKRKSSGMTCHSPLHFIASSYSFQDFETFLDA